MKSVLRIIRDWVLGIRRCQDCAGILTCVGQPPFEIRICEPCRTQERIKGDVVCGQYRSQVVFTIKDAPRCQSFEDFVRKYEKELLDMAKKSPPELPGLRRS